MADGFLGRWSQRKQALREGKALPESPQKPPPQPVPSDSPAVTAAAPTELSASPAAPAPPSMEDVTRLTSQSDFTPFVARGVAPEVRNAAMKKLFADPHYNVMDGLDIYIDDYSRPDPLPLSMLRQMASAKFLNLFEDETAGTGPAGASSGPRDDANTPAADSVAQSAPQPASHVETPCENQPRLTGTEYDHTDLRLQQDHAAGPQESGRGTQ